MCAEKLRLFVAADIPDKVRGRLSSAMDEFRHELEGARWVEARNLHITLKFIGHIGEEGLARLSNELHAAAGRSAPFRVALGGCGAFPSRGKARVVWVGMCGGMEEARELARRIDSRLERAGVAREERPFRGHLTLARLRRPRDCSALLDRMSARLEALRDMPFEVGEIVLYRSMLSPQGPTYEALQRIGLGGRGGEKG